MKGEVVCWEDRKEKLGVQKRMIVEGNEEAGR
jgi:hypothetical protein